MKMRGFTILELIIVLVIVSVLATLSFVHYGSYREKSLDNEAEANLAMIIDAERVYRMERSAYFFSPNEAQLNTNLRLFLPTAANRPWDYSTVLVGAACCAQARRTGGPNIRNWKLCSNGNMPVPGTCNACP